MDLREILFAQFPAFFLLSLLFLIAHLRVRKHSAVKSVLWVLLFGAALAVSILFCFLGMQAKYWTVINAFLLRLLNGDTEFTVFRVIFGSNSRLA